MSFNVGLSGLQAATTDLDVTGNNIANVGTTGFKSSRAEFADLYANSMNLGSTSNSTGNGVQVAAVSQQFTQGNITTTGATLDLAISGNGFFVLSGNGSQVYTRDGTFSTDSDGYIVNSSGYNLQGYAVDANGSVVSGVLTDLQVDTSSQTPKATTEVDQTLSLNSAASVPTTTPFDSSDSTSYNWSTSATIYDSQGNSHTLTQYFAKDASNEWTMYVLVDGRNPADPTSTDPYSAEMTFSSSGALTSTTSSDFTVNADGSITLSNWVPATVTDSTTDPVTYGSNGAAAAAAGITLDLTSTTQTSTSFAVTSVSQDGYATGQLSGLTIDSEGQLFATYTNGESKLIGQVALANFANTQGLTALGNNAWAQSSSSGEPVIGVPGSGTLGSLTSGALEDSNVDLTAELVNLIVAQRNYQANAKTIETENTLAQTIIQMT
ncbi:flagellar hook protein FlgE [Pseudomonas sp. LRF_L74]|uniref:flagellar hook protein FlgE n=1 Tax=Pseudomonas sp. LRF_L74 TaxID=3369422 RepID=UPI003F5E49BD